MPRPEAFQSTLSVRRATIHIFSQKVTMDISIHALRKESDFQNHRERMGQATSIHALRKESDRIDGAVQIFHIISIHALRKESDPQARETRSRIQYFNPRSP